MLTEERVEKDMSDVIVVCFDYTGLMSRDAKKYN